MLVDFTFLHQSIVKDPLYPHDDSMLPYNKKKNRFCNIIPCEFSEFFAVWLCLMFPSPPDDQSRVKLRSLEGIEGSDYINASHVEVNARLFFA